MVFTGPLLPSAPRLQVYPELSDEDVKWLNEQLGHVDTPDVKYTNIPPPLSQAWVKYDAG